MFHGLNKLCISNRKYKFARWIVYIIIVKHFESKNLKKNYVKVITITLIIF